MILYWPSKKKNCVRGKPADFLFGNLGRTFLCGRFIFAITGEYTNMKLQLIKRPNDAQSIPYKIARAVYAETNAKTLRVVEALTSMIKNNAVSTGNNIEDIISNNNVVMPTGGCTVDSRNVTVDLPDFPGSAEIPLGVYCSSEQKLSFYLSGATTDSSRQVFANTAPDATKASGVGVTLMRNGKILATGENVSLGTVNKSKVPLGLSATYGQTGNKVSAGTVQSVIGVTFIYE